MRYVIEFLVPAMIVIVVAVVLFRNRTNTPAPASASQTKDDTGTLSTGTFVVDSDHRRNVHSRADLRAAQRHALIAARPESAPARTHRCA